MGSYYNEIDPFKAEVLRQAIKAGAIAQGVVDERSIVDVKPTELMGYTQCHFFAGGGFWSRALRDAGIKDDEPWWTGSCPCQPFSGAGKGDGFADERHLWPYWHHLIRVCRPSRIFGEQVASKDGLAWLDLVQADMEGVGYACGPIVSPAAGYGAPHGRHRIYFMAHPMRIGVGAGLRDNGKNGFRWLIPANRRCIGNVSTTGKAADVQRMGEPIREGLEGYAGNGYDRNQSRRDREDASRSTAEAGPIGILANDHEDRFGTTRKTGPDQSECDSKLRGPVGGFWRDAEWIPCRHPKIPGAIEWRPIKPGTFCLADGSPSRVGSLRLYGDGIVLPQATAFIEASKEIIDSYDPGCAGAPLPAPFDAPDCC